MTAICCHAPLLGTTMEVIFTPLSPGLLATASPCVLPLYPRFLAYISGGHNELGGKWSRYFLGFFVLAGVLTMMLALGGLIALLSISIGRALSIIIPLADAVLIGPGVMLLPNINPFKTLPQIQVPVLSHPFVNAFLYGLLYGRLRSHVQVLWWTSRAHIQVLTDQWHEQ